jgi:hypothetical protein
MLRDPGKPCVSEEPGEKGHGECRLPIAELTDCKTAGGPRLLLNCTKRREAAVFVENFDLPKSNVS